MPIETFYQLFAASPPGLEPYTAQELVSLKLLYRPIKEAVTPGSGGIEFPTDLKGVYAANLWLRTANRVLLRLGRFQAVKFTELRRKTGNLPWEAYLHPGQPVALRVTCHRSKLYHSGGVAQRVAEAIGDRLGTIPEIEKGSEDEIQAPLVVVRLVEDECTISIDSSGTGLHRRGYRLATAKAPLRETLAAGLLLASGWDETSPFNRSILRLGHHSYRSGFAGLSPAAWFEPSLCFHGLAQFQRAIMGKTCPLSGPGQ